MDSCKEAHLEQARGSNIIKTYCHSKVRIQNLVVHWCFEILTAGCYHTVKMLSNQSNFLPQKHRS